jgi:DUF1680 family protein
VLDLDMPVRVMRPHPRSNAARGCVALTRGPLVYCVEQTDLPAGVALEDVRIDPLGPAIIGLRGTPQALTVRGTVEPPATDERHTAAAPVNGSTPITCAAIPYFLWDNRTAGPMRVWIPATKG